MKTKRTCLITGATKGLGASLAYRFWEADFDLYLVARSESGLVQIAKALPERSGQQVVRLPCDLSDPFLVSELALKAKTQLRRLDVLINNAAVQGPIGPAWENDFSMWQHVIQTNLLAPVMLCSALIPLMRKGGGGAIINLSGGGATGPRPNFSAYATAKAGLVRFSETIAEELKGTGIRVNCIAPGAMKTAMLQSVLATGAELAGEREFAIANKVFSEGGASMDRVADLALFLATEASTGITGRLVSAVWDRWGDWPAHLEELAGSDAYTLRRITGRDRGFNWGDK